VRPVRRLSPAPANLTITEVLTAYEDCRMHKRRNATTIDFECDFFHNVMQIYQSICDKTWKPKGHMCFVVKSPKVREVWASPFDDRVVHHIIYNRIRPRFEPQFIATSFACIPDRGTGAATKWAERSARKVTQHWSRDAYVLQMDIANFFPSINTKYLCEKLLTKCSEDWLSHLVKEIILVDVKKNAHFPGDQSLFELIPKHKSLWHTEDGYGLPIGNLTSQFGANVLLDEIDQFVVRSFPDCYYGRYVDDICILHTDRNEIQKIKERVEENLLSIGHTLNLSKTSIKPIDCGFDFCGKFIKPFRSYLRRSTVRRGNAAMNRLRKSDHPAETATSYLAIARHCNAYKLRKQWASKIRKAGMITDASLTKALSKKVRKI
jgi:RNA-directed DNA polymerase